jgi:hypothetical protein
VRVPGEVVTDTFAFAAVLWVGEGEGDGCGGAEGGEVGGEGVMPSVVCFEDDIAEAEGGAGVFVASVAVLSGAEEEVECQPDEVCDGRGLAIAGGVGGVGVVEEFDGDWFDLCWGWVCSMICVKLA